MKSLYNSLLPCQKEEEVKSEFCKFFKMKIFALRGIDHYAEHVLFEFKYDRNFTSAENVARVLAQVMYYARMLKYGAGLTRYPLPPYICVVDKNEAFFAETKDYAKFPAATCFQYDYLTDDIPALAGQMTFGQTRKMPPNLVADLANPDIKWIVFINPPFATANTVSGETGKKSKDTVSKTTIREWMGAEGYGEASRELFTQFLFRISKEFDGRQAYLGMFSKLKYINSNNDQKIRDGFFQYQYERGFIFPIKCFYGATGNFPV